MSQSENHLSSKIGDPVSEENFKLMMENASLRAMEKSYRKLAAAVRAWSKCVDRSCVYCNSDLMELINETELYQYTRCECSACIDFSEDFTFQEVLGGRK